jgi:ankyrin repeat protein
MVLIGYLFSLFCSLWRLLTAVDESGALPIHWTSEHGYHTLLPLVTRPEILNTQDKNGWSALHYAAANNRIETVK